MYIHLESYVTNDWKNMEFINNYSIRIKNILNVNFTNLLEIASKSTNIFSFRNNFNRILPKLYETISEF